jgi:hypothetical protein
MQNNLESQLSFCVLLDPNSVSEFLPRVFESPMHCRDACGDAGELQGAEIDEETLMLGKEKAYVIKNNYS